MSTLRKLLLLGLALFLLTAAVLTWGSVGSMILIFCLVTMGSALLVQRFLVNRDDDQFQED